MRLRTRKVKQEEEVTQASASKSPQKKNKEKKRGSSVNPDQKNAGNDTDAACSSTDIQSESEPEAQVKEQDLEEPNPQEEEKDKELTRDTKEQDIDSKPGDDSVETEVHSESGDNYEERDSDMGLGSDFVNKEMSTEQCWSTSFKGDDILDKEGEIEPVDAPEETEKEHNIGDDCTEKGDDSKPGDESVEGKVETESADNFVERNNEMESSRDLVNKEVTTEQRGSTEIENSDMICMDKKKGKIEDVNLEVEDMEIDSEEETMHCEKDMGIESVDTVVGTEPDVTLDENVNPPVPAVMVLEKKIDSGNNADGNTNEMNMDVNSESLLENVTNDAPKNKGEKQDEDEDDDDVIFVGIQSVCEAKSRWASASSSDSDEESVEESGEDCSGNSRNNRSRSRSPFRKVSKSFPEKRAGARSRSSSPLRKISKPDPESCSPIQTVSKSFPEKQAAGTSAASKSRGGNIICPECQIPVKDINKHMKRAHTSRDWGYQCNCGFSSTMVMSGLFRSHRMEVHNDSHVVLSPYKVAVPDGYVNMEQCSLCKFQGFTKEHVGIHQDVVHGGLPLPPHCMEDVDYHGRPKFKLIPFDDEDSLLNYEARMLREMETQSITWNRRAHQQQRDILLAIKQAYDSSPVSHLSDAAQGSDSIYGKCRVCNERVANRLLERHTMQMHTQKIWGYQCPCGFSASHLDDDRFKLHRMRVHGAKAKDDLVKFKVSVLQGYKDMLNCRECDFVGFTKDHVAAHRDVIHFGVQPYGRMLARQPDGLPGMPPLKLYPFDYDEPATTHAKRGDHSKGHLSMDEQSDGGDESFSSILASVVERVESTTPQNTANEHEESLSSVLSSVLSSASRRELPGSLATKDRHRQDFLDAFFGPRISPARREELNSLLSRAAPPVSGYTDDELKRMLEACNRYYPDDPKTDELRALLASRALPPLEGRRHPREHEPWSRGPPSDRYGPPPDHLRPPPDRLRPPPDRLRPPARPRIPVGDNLALILGKIQDIEKIRINHGEKQMVSVDYQHGRTSGPPVHDPRDRRGPPLHNTRDPRGPPLHDPRDPRSLSRDQRGPPLHDPRDPRGPPLHDRRPSRDHRMDDLREYRVPPVDAWRGPPTGRLEDDFRHIPRDRRGPAHHYEPPGPRGPMRRDPHGY